MWDKTHMLKQSCHFILFLQVFELFYCVLIWTHLSALDSMFNVVPGEVTSMFTVTEKVKCPVSRAKACIQYVAMAMLLLRWFRHVMWQFRIQCPVSVNKSYCSILLENKKPSIPNPTRCNKAEAEWGSTCGCLLRTTTNKFKSAGRKHKRQTGKESANR